MLIDYISSLADPENICASFEESILNIFSREGKSEDENIPYFVWLLPYQRYFKPVKACVEVCRILKPESLENPDFLFESASQLENTSTIKCIKDMKLYLKCVKASLNVAKEELSAICSAFDDEEKERINEAIHSCIEGCNYSCVAMSVSAVESRLLKLMCLTKPDSKQQLEKKTLGQLIQEYVEHKSEYQNVVPEKHEPLLDLCNTYRTFSVHPKKQKIKSTISNSILNLAIEFLVDHDTKPEVIQARLVASEEGK